MPATEWDGFGPELDDDETAHPLEPEPLSALRPRIKWGTDLDRVRSEVVRALAHRGRLYQRAHALVYAVQTDAGLTSIRVATRAMVRAEISRVVELVGGKGKPIQVPDVLAAIVSDAGEWPGIRVLEGVVTAPTMRPDGTVLQDPGYDVETRTLYVPRCEYLTVSACPTEADARAALAVLQEPWVDFLWSTPSDGVAAIAAMVTLVVRTALPSVPIILLESPVPGGGKSLGGDVITCGATGRPIARAPCATGEEEREKQLLSYVMSGQRCLVLDDVGVIGGHVLNAVATATGEISMRPLGRSELLTLPWRGALIGSGNNVRIIGDCTRRVLRVRIDPGVENPEDRSGWQHDPLVPWVATRHVALVHAALTLVRWGVVCYVPRSRQWGSYEDWVRLVAAPLVALGCADPTLTRDDIQRSSDDVTAARAAVLHGWEELYAPDGITAAELRRRVWGSERDRHLDGLREGLEMLTKCRGKEPTATEIGYALRGMRDRVVDGVSLRQYGQDKSGQNLWVAGRRT